MTPVFLSLLRLPSLRMGTQPSVGLSRKDAALLAVLAMDGACSRDMVAQILWPDGDEAKARASLRQRRYRLAHSVGRVLIEGETTLRLAEGVEHEVADPEAQLLRDASALQGDLLQGLAYDDCPEYARWLECARERWRTSRAQALSRLATRLMEQGRLGRAIELARRLCADEPLSEHAHRQLMSLHYAQGDLGAALQQYQQLAKRLDAELGELPDEETAALAAKLRLGQAPVRTVATPTVPPALHRPPRLIGRETAWAALEAARAERAALVVEGAPGLGKTRLLRDFIADCGADRALLVPARAGDSQRPYGLLVRLLSGLLLGPTALHPEVLNTLPDWVRYELAALLPELGVSTPRTDPLRLQRSVEVVMQQAALEVVALDDVQAADAATLELLASWVGAGMPAWVLACRAGEVPAALNQWLQASEGPRRVALQPLGTDEIELLLQDLELPDFDAREWAGTLARHTGGLPLFVLETLRVVLEQPEQARSTLPLPKAVAQAIRARVAHLPEAARQLANVAAVLRAPLPPDAGPALLGGQPAQWVEAQARLEAAQWVDANGMMHDLTSAALRDAMPAVERRWLHGNVARWLMRGGDSGQAVAMHFEEAGMFSDAAEQFEIAAQRARSASRPIEELDLWERAAALWERLAQRERVFAALHESIEPYKTARGGEAALTRAERLVDTAVSIDEMSKAALSLCDVLMMTGRESASVVALTRALSLVKSTDNPITRVRVHNFSAVRLCQEKRIDEALAVMREIESELQDCGFEERLLYLSVQVLTYIRTDKLQQALVCSRKRLELAESKQDRMHSALAAAEVASILCALGMIISAIDAAEESRRHWQSLGPVTGEYWIPIELISVKAQIAGGQIGTAIRKCERLSSYLSIAKPSNSIRLLYFNTIAMCYSQMGAVHSALKYLLLVSESDLTSSETEQHRYVVLRAIVAATEGEDPSVWLQTARDLASKSSMKLSMYAQIDAAAIQCGLGADDPEVLAEMEQRARSIELGSVAMTIAWYRVDALRRRGDTAAAAVLARELLDQPLQPTLLLPCHWLWIAHAALDAAHDLQASEVGARAAQAYAKMTSDLGDLPGPPAQWPGPMTAWRMSTQP